MDIGEPGFWAHRVCYGPALLRTTWKLYGPPDAPKPTRPSVLCAPAPLSSRLYLLAFPSFQRDSFSFLSVFFFLQACLDLSATTKTDHAMTVRALSTSTESITGNNPNGKMLFHSLRNQKTGANQLGRLCYCLMTDAAEVWKRIVAVACDCC